MLKHILIIPLCCYALQVQSLPIYASDADSEDGWYPFVLAEKLDPDSPANIGKLVLDPPAGKHGFVKVKDGHFYFEDGTYARFWGTNLSINACFPTKDEAELIADRVAFFGFNSVRLHYMDAYYAPKGIFKDIYPLRSNILMKKSGVLSTEQLDRLDYLIYQLKIRGIYLDLNLVVRRKFTFIDGMIEANNFGGGAKPISMFNPRLIELQKQYAKDLLTHYNPYTSLRYCDDPTFALIEIINESSIIASWKADNLDVWSPRLKRNQISRFYVEELDNLWNEYLNEKHDTFKKKTGIKTKTVISNFRSFRPINSLIRFYPQEARNDIKEFYLELQAKYFSQMIHHLRTDCCAKIPITGIGGYRTNEDIESQESCDFIDYHTYWDHPNFSNAKWDKNDFTIHNQSIFNNGNLSYLEWTSYKAPISKKKPFTISEWNHCYPNQYAYETPVAIACFAAKNNWDGLFQFQFSNGWSVKPSFDNIDFYFNCIANPQQLILCSLGSYIYLKNQCNFSLANLTFTLDSPFIKGVIGFIKGAETSFDSFSIKSANDGAVVIFSATNKPILDSAKLILITMSEVKNSESGWVDGKFKWGHSPTLLKKMDVSLKIFLKKKFNVYELDAEGRRGTKILTDYKNGTLSFSTCNSESPWFEISTY